MRYSLTLTIILFTAVLAGASIAVSKRQWTMATTLSGHGAAAVAVAINESGQQAAVLDAQGKLTLWNLKTHLQMASVNLHGQLQKQLPAGHAVLAVGAKGDEVAASAVGLGTVVWRAGKQPKIVRLQTGQKWMPLLAVSHDDSMVATVSHSGKMTLWDVKTGKLIASKSTGWQQAELGAVVFSPADRAVGVCKAGLPFARKWMLVRNGQAHLYAYQNGISDWHTSLWQNWHTAHFLMRMESVQLYLIKKGQMINFKSRVVLRIRHTNNATTPSAVNHISPMSHSSMVHDPVALTDVSPDRQSAIAGTTTGGIRLFRAAVPGDMWLSPIPYLTIIAGIGMLGWREYVKKSKNTDAQKKAHLAYVQTDAPLPLSLRIAGWIFALSGLFVIVNMGLDLFHDQLKINLALLLLPAGLWMQYKRSNGWRIFLVVITWIVVISLAVNLGILLANGKTDLNFIIKYRLTTHESKLLVATLLLAVSTWLLWAISNPRITEIFTAPRRRDGLARLIHCIGCGYDVRSVVVRGGHACPECGQTLSYNSLQQERVREDFIIDDKDLRVLWETNNPGTPQENDSR